MKSVFIAGSRKFFADVEKLVKLCKGNGIEAKTAGKILNQEDTFESESSALLRAFQIIDKSDIVYVIANGGYVGTTVALEIAYSFSRNKEIVASETIKDFSAKSLVSKVVKPEDFIEYVKS